MFIFVHFMVIISERWVDKEALWDAWPWGEKESEKLKHVVNILA